ncbi:MAG: cohesin domain-containing protein [bacterium]|nr:cohesin domain-containing protein [bacterium]
MSLKNIFLSVAAFGFLFLIFSDRTNAAGASLYLSPASGTYNIGETFKISIKLDSGGSVINAADGVLSFNPEGLSVVSISKTGSAFNLWTTEPAFSNSAGSIIFGGGTTTNFSGASGTIVAITFRAKDSGKHSVNFSSGSILASDGKGTNILSGMASGVYVINPRATDLPLKETSISAVNNTPKAPNVFSSTHPDQSRWYSNENPKISWDLEKDITGVNLLVDQSAVSIPAKRYKEPLSEKQLEEIGNGVSYFHVQLCNKFGCGGVAHFKLQIDTIKPEAFEIKIKEGEKTSNPHPTIAFETKDVPSGINYYQVKIGETDWVETRGAEYRLSDQPWGKRTIIVKAVDKAGNSTLAVTEVEILPLETPRITDYPKELISGAKFSIAGTAPADATVKIYIQKDGKTEEFQAKSDKAGKWNYAYAKVAEKGVYGIWAEASDLRGARSDLSEKIFITVIPPTYLRIGKLLIDYLTISIILLILLLIIIFIILWAWKKIKERSKKVKRKATDAEKGLVRAFRHLEKEVEKQVMKFDRNPKRMSRKEKVIYNSLGKALRVAEKFIGKEIKDIESELRK